MSTPYIGEIRIFGFNFAPYQWALCNGQIMPIKQNEALYSLLGKTYGGTGNNFALPNLQGCRPVMAGQGPNLSPYQLGQTGGATVVPLNTSQLALHSHAASASTGRGGATPGTNTVWSQGSQRDAKIYAPAGSNVQMSPGVASNVGGAAPHNNLQPYLTLNFCIALTGVYPQKT